MATYQSFNFKLSPPYSRVPLIHREQLHDQIVSCSDHKVVFVTAPAGFGKSVFLMQWYEHLRAEGTDRAWLTLEKSDSDRSTQTTKFANGKITCA